VLKGDLSTTTIAEVLRRLADGDASGCLHVTDPAGEVARTYLRGGRVYAVVAPGRRPQLGSRLVSSGALAPEALAEALEAQRTELQGWRLGELLVHLGYVDQPVVQAFVEEQVRESLSDVLPWRSGAWKFRVNERTREDVAPPTAVDVLLDEITSRRSHWAAMEQTLHGPDSVPVLSTAGSSSNEMQIDPDAWSLLCKVDGARSITELARECGFTLYEAGQVVFTLVGAGLLEVEDAPVAREVDLDDAEVEPLAPADVASRLVSALLATPTHVPSQAWAPDEEQVTESRQVSTRSDDASVNSSISRVSEALAGLLGPATADDDVFSGPTHRAAPPPAPVVPEDPRKAERARRTAARREADAEELATAQAELEAARAAEQERRDDLLPDGHVAEVVDLHEVREAARLDEQARAEQQRQEEAVEQVAAEQAEADRIAAEIEAARLETERRAAEQAEHERLAAEQAEADRAEQERAAAEVEAVRREAQRLAAEQAESDRLAQERVTAEAAQQEQERLFAQVEVERLAAAEQVRLDEELALAARAEFAEAARLEQESAAAAKSRAEEAAATDFASYTAEFDEPELPSYSADHAEAQAAAFAELSASASMDVADIRPAARGAVADAADPEPAPSSWDDEPVPFFSPADTDTASLLRELSSLGLDDDPPSSTPTRPARPPSTRPVAETPKKRKGLFGRG